MTEDLLLLSSLFLAFAVLLFQLHETPRNMNLGAQFAIVLFQIIAAILIILASTQGWGP